jgi:adenylate kinase
MAAGQLVPDDVTIRVVQERTAQDDCRDGYILDGFRARPHRQRCWRTLAAEQGNKIHAIHIRMPREALAQRNGGRRNCPVCGEIYNIYFKPPRHDNVCDFHPRPS